MYSLMLVFTGLLCCLLSGVLAILLPTGPISFMTVLAMMVLSIILGRIGQNSWMITRR